VASELRTLIGALRMSATLERMGDLAEHLAQIARNSYPASAVPPELQSTIREMGELAVQLAREDGEIISSLDVEHALRMETEDDRMDELQRELMAMLLADDWPHSVETAVEMAMAVRFYERFADHSVSVARRIVHQATGQRMERIEQN
jgi:phosphate transport system protein